MTISMSCQGQRKGTGARKGGKSTPCKEGGNGLRYRSKWEKNLLFKAVIKNRFLKAYCLVCGIEISAWMALVKLDEVGVKYKRNFSSHTTVSEMFASVGVRQARVRQSGL